MFKKWNLVVTLLIINFIVTIKSAQSQPVSIFGLPVGQYKVRTKF